MIVTAKYLFTSWSGDITGNANPATIEMPALDIAIVANYSMSMRRLSFSSTPIAVQISVKVGVNAPVPVNSGQSIDVPEGETVVITAPSEVSG